MRVCITAGGTGGHIVPALSFAEKLKEKIPESEVLFITGKKRTSERRFVEAGEKLNDIIIDRFTFIDVKGIAGKDIRSAIYGIISVFKSVPEVKRILSDFHPHITLGFGGYLTAPVLISSKMLGVKTAIHEQNSVMGLTNKISSLFVDAIMTSFDDTEGIPYISRSKVRKVGIPLRKKFLQDFDRGKKDKEKLMGDGITVFITGGSQGAVALNRLFLDTLETLLPKLKGKKLVIYHQTGDFSFEEVKARYRKIQEKFPDNISLHVFPFTDEVGYYLGLCDFVVARGGAGTVFEIAYAKKPAIFVPLPHSIGGHQEKNPKKLFHDSCVIVPQSRKDRFEIALWDMIEGDLLRRMKEKLESKFGVGGREGSIIGSGAEGMVSEVENLLNYKGSPHV